MSLEESQAALEVLRKFVTKQLVEGEDYGVIPGTRGKPSLFQQGAQKICMYFNLTPVPTLVRELMGAEFVSKTYSVTLIHRGSGKPVASCVGSCNSAERRFYRRDTPTFTDARECENTIDKMAQKRALVGAVILATRAAGEFTQDVEDTQPRNEEPPRKSVPAITAMPWGKYKGVPLVAKESGEYVVSDELLRRVIEWANKREAEGGDAVQAKSIRDGATVELARREGEALGEEDESGEGESMREARMEAEA
jgi:hypothetical protein